MVRIARLLPLLAIALLGCGSDAGSTGPQTVALSFKIDAQTCTGSAAINFFIDGSLVGTETLNSGGVSKTYTTTAANHVLGAAVANTNGRVWGPFNQNLTGYAVFSQVLSCS